MESHGLAGQLEFRVRFVTALPRAGSAYAHLMRQGFLFPREQEGHVSRAENAMRSPLGDHEMPPSPMSLLSPPGPMSLKLVRLTSVPCSACRCQCCRCCCTTRASDPPPAPL